MSELVTLDEAKLHLRVTGTAQDAEIELLLDTAEAIVFKHIGYVDLNDLYAAFGEADHFDLEAATKLVLTKLYDKRDEDPLSEAAKSLLVPWRQPVIG